MSNKRLSILFLALEAALRNAKTDQEREQAQAALDVWCDMKRQEQALDRGYLEPEERA